MVGGMVDALDVDGRRIVVQTEDKGFQREEIVTSAFEGGALVYRRVVSYSDLVKLELSDQNDLLATALQDLHTEVLRSLGHALRGEAQGTRT